MALLAFAAENPITACVLAFLAVCALVGIVDRIMEPARLRARARCGIAEAERLRVIASRPRLADELQPPRSDGSPYRP